MFSEFFKRNGFSGINGNQRGEKETWGGKRYLLKVVQGLFYGNVV
jgi:hypothetical protein